RYSSHCTCTFSVVSRREPLPALFPYTTLFRSTRVNGDVLPYMRYDMFSLPGEMVTQQKGSQVKAYPEIVLTSAEAYFLRAEAILRGLAGATGDAQELFADGIREAMKIWEVPSGDVETYIANEDAADI